MVKGYHLTCLCLAGMAMLPGYDCGKTERLQQAFREGRPVITALPADTAVLVDTLDYNARLQRLAHWPASSRWPVKAAYPLRGAILPFKRVVAFYGNLYSGGMGILGALPPEQMLGKLQEEVQRWTAADTTTPVVPALHYIAVTAQRTAGAAGRYNLRMPDQQIDKVLELAARSNALVCLDIQVGHSHLQDEIPLLKKYLSMPQVHLGIDPEYSMKDGNIPCASIGSFDAEDINYASGWLANLVREQGIPPKILVVHRFTQAMVTNYGDIRTRPEVQIVMNMDGFGFPGRKIDTYVHWIAGQPVQFTGFKLFYINDVRDKRSTGLMTPQQVLALTPQPIYIQYQ